MKAKTVKTAKNDAHTHTNDKNPLDLVSTILDEAKLEPKLLEDYSAYLILLDNDPYIEGGIAKIHENSDYFTFHLDMRNKVTKKYLGKVAEFITRANYGLGVGNFEMDYSDGTVRFKTSFCYKGDELSENLVRNTVLIAMGQVEKYGGVLTEVMKGKKTPQQAIDETD